MSTPPRRQARALRTAFVDAFVGAGHTHVKSSPLVPQGDQTLMFANAGMVQFKHVFAGAEQRPYKRAVSVQKCMRVSGKHNDLEEVGRTARHHTFFEMLGNFSFGDYFKEEAIALAWRFVQQDLAIDPKRIWVTTFAGDDATPADDEARTLWRKISGLPQDRIVPMGAADNFWSMGDTGPCGPCTEIHVDLGQGPATQADFANGRIVEIWNVVFMQYLRQASGALGKLAATGVDTGMGLERVAALAQEQTSNYHADLFAPLLARIGDIAKRTYGRSASEDDVSMRVIADHARAAAFLIADGVQPTADGRGYVLRRIMRRAIRHGQRLGIEQTFFHKVAGCVVDTMGADYPELTDAEALVAKVCENEEEGFRRTLGGGLKVLSTALGSLLDQVKQGTRPTLSGEVAFKLYDTYGFPKDLTDTIAEEHGVAVDAAGFDAMMQAQQTRSRGRLGGAQGPDPAIYQQIVREVGSTNFIGYPHEDTPLSNRPGRWRESGGTLQAACRVVALLVDGERVANVPAGASAQVVVDPCPLYGEGGGQVGDVGSLYTDDAPDAPTADNPGAATSSAKPAAGGKAAALVRKATKPVAELTVLDVEVVHGTLQVGQQIWAGYDVARRRSLRAHHSATHLLHAALRKVLGPHVTQAGSLVEPGRLRFDFSHFAAVNATEIAAIEAAVQTEIAAHHPIVTEELSFEAARNKGALALFGEKYGDEVRVLSMGESIEFCGGTHASNTAELGLFLVTREQAVQAGVRRIEAEVGPAAARRGRLLARRLARLAEALGAAGCQEALHKLAAAGSDIAGADAAAFRVADDSNGNGSEAAGGNAGDSGGDKAAAGTGGASDDDGESVLQLADKLLAATRERTDALAAVDGPSFKLTPQALGITRPSLPAQLDAPCLLALRNTWQAIAQLLQGRGGDGSKLLAELGGQDIGHLAAAIVSLQATAKQAERALGASTARNLSGLGRQLAERAKTLANGIKLVVHVIDDEGESAVDLKALADNVRQALGEGAVGLAACRNGRVSLLVALTPTLAKRAQAGKLVGRMATHVGGRGGGRADMAQAGGTDAAGIPAAMADLADSLAAV